jgi:glycosyltransferase involved in cell wall biosynthesis
VEVLTTCSRDYQSWANHYSAGVSRDGPVTVRRFESVQRRQWRLFGWMSGILFRLARIVPLPAFVEREWAVQQGPCCPDLLRYLDCRRAHYDAFLFFTCLYYPTVCGLPLVKDRAVLAPTAHDEPALRFALYRRALQAPRALVFQSEFEREFVHRRFGNSHLPWVTAGAGVELGEASPPENWLLFVGRIEVGKGCLELFDAVRSSGVELVVAGPAAVQIPAHVRYEGVVSEAHKRELLSRCRAVVVPSVMESLSILALEGWAFGKPVVARRGTPVARMVEECEGGVVFESWSEFGEAIRTLQPGMGERGRKYVAERFTWERVVSRYRDMIELVIKRRSAGGGM